LPPHQKDSGSATVRRRNFDVNVIGDHLNLVEKMHTFCLDPSLLNLKVCSSTFICLKVSTRSAQNLKMQWWRIRDKMSETSIEKLRCKRPISWKWSCRGDFFFYLQKTLCHLEVYNSTTSSWKVSTRSSKTANKRDEWWVNNASSRLNP
jgi:hypothetical protein